MRKPKVAYSAKAIMASLYGSKGRPETNEYANRCAAQYRRRTGASTESLRVVEEYKPKERHQSESPRTKSKWAAARARAARNATA